MKRIQLENRSDLKAEIPLEAPYSIFIDPSSVCNFKCKFCMNKKIRSPKIMSLDMFTGIIDSLQEFETPVKVIRLYGFGEPLINPNFCEMVKYAKASSKVLSVDTTTNGSLINKKYAGKLVESGIDRINISIESLSTEGYKAFTGRDVDFKALVKNLTYLYRIKKETTIFIKICGDYLTDEEKAEFYRIFTPISDGCDIEHVAQCWYDTKIENVNTEVGIYGQPLENVEVCPYIFYSLMVQSDGKVSLCFLDWNKKLLIGDIKHKSVYKIWHGDELKVIQKMMLKKKKPDICKTCQQLKAGMPVNLDPHAKEILKRIK
jgi:radical SAM protein with 4Fe4S-binding SPASM domain